ncbi:MAG TPA: 16S rRNA (cytidine(1402)-2'-O)-methyltransferase [bacterium]
MPLYIVATPIGNLEDITQRAAALLRSADLIACEDTRKTSVLLRRYGIKTPCLSYHEHNERRRTPYILSQLQEGKTIALVSNAGTPLISDPGYILVTEAIKTNVDVYPLPGPSALLAALCVSGLPIHKFVFEGFLPKKKAARRKLLASLKNEQRTVVFFESPYRIIDVLRDIQEILGERRIAVARELTKIHESVYRGTAKTVLENLKTVKGEFTIMIDGDHE